MIFKLAWRNLWRAKRRTLITLISVVFAFFLSFTFTTLADGSYAKMIDSAARSGYGHVTVEPIGYRDKPGTDLVVSDSYRLAEHLTMREDIDHVAVRIAGQVMVASAAETTGAAFAAVDPTIESKILFPFEHIIEGESLPGRTGRKVMIGSGMAKRLGVKLKSKLVLTLADKSGEVVNGLVRVVGIFETGTLEIDNYMILLPIDFMRGLLGYDANDATQIALYITDQREAAQIAKEVTPLAADHSAVAVSWHQTMPEVAGAIAMDRGSNYIFQIFIFLLVTAGILNTIMMSVLERFREFGIMLAVGMTHGRLWRLIMTETVWLAIVGIVVGLGVSFLMYWYLSTTGLDTSQWMKEEQSFGGVALDPVYKSILYVDHVATIVGGVFLLILLSGIYPAFLATRTKPVEVIKGL